jgi:hypothetical protein
MQADASCPTPCQTQQNRRGDVFGSVRAKRSSVARNVAGNHRHGRGVAGRSAGPYNASRFAEFVATSVWAAASQRRTGRSRSASKAARFSTSWVRCSPGGIQPCLIARRSSFRSLRDKRSADFRAAVRRRRRSTPDRPRLPPSVRRAESTELDSGQFDPGPPAFFCGDCGSSRPAAVLQF